MGAQELVVDGKAQDRIDTISPIVHDEAVQVAIESEHNLSFGDAVKLYPTAIGWSVFFSLGVIMLAFDPQLLGNLYATPAFQKDFGYLYDGDVSGSQILRFDRAD